MATPTTTTKSSTALDTFDDWGRDLEGFEEQDTELGEKIVWKDTPGFKGVYLGPDTMEVPNQTTGELEPALYHQFKDGHGTLCFAWGSPQLNRGLSKAAIGCEVAILWGGLKDRPGGKVGQMNTFRVATKNPAAAELTA